MAQTFGIESHGEHSHTPHRPPARYLVILDVAGGMVARLYGENFEPVGEFDAASEEVSVMTRGLAPSTGASGAEWDATLQAYDYTQRSQAQVFTLDV